MLLEVFIFKVSDIYIEFFNNGGIVCYRVDGMLRVILELFV